MGCLQVYSGRLGSFSRFVLFLKTIYYKKDYKCKSISIVFLKNNNIFFLLHKIQTPGINMQKPPSDWTLTLPHHLFFTKYVPFTNIFDVLRNWCVCAYTVFIHKSDKFTFLKVVWRFGTLFMYLDFQKKKLSKSQLQLFTSIEQKGEYLKVCNLQAGPLW